MSAIDPFLIVYSLAGLIIVMLVYIVLSFFTDGVRSVNNHMKEKEKKKKEEERSRRAA